MELDQWIAVYAAVSTWAAARERSAWSVFCGGVIGCGVLLAIAAYAMGGALLFAQQLALGVAALGLAVSVIWALALAHTLHEGAHWGHLLCSIESQLAGAEFHRSSNRMAQGEQVCIPSALHVCGQWHPQAVRSPWPLRMVPKLIAVCTPLLFFLAFAAVLVGTILAQLPSISGF